MSAETSGDVSRIQDEDVLRQMWQETEDFGKKKAIRSHMYKLREERLRNIYSSTDQSTEIQRAQSTPGLNDKSSKEGNGPTHADSLADHSFLSLKSKEIRDSESPTRDMNYKVTGKTQGGDQGWNVVTKNETSSDGKTHTTTRVASTSGSEKIDGGVANYAAKCEQQASVYSDGDPNNFTKSVSASSKNVIKQEAKGGDDHNNFQSFATSTSSSSKSVTHHHSSSGDTDLKTLPSNVNDSSTTVIRKTYTTDAPAELRKGPNYVDGNTKVTTETRTLPDGTRVTTTRYETTSGGKTVTSSSTDYASSKQVVSEQKSSSVKSSSSKTETHSSNRMIQDSRNTHDDVNRRTIKQTGDTQIIRHVPESFDNTERTVSVQVVRSANDDANQNISQSVNKTSSSTVNVQRSQKVIDSKNFDINIENQRVLQDVHDTRRDVNQIQSTKDVDQIGSQRIIHTKDLRDTQREGVERNVDVRQEHHVTKDVRTHTSQDVRGANQDDVRITRLIQEKEYLPRDIQPDFDRTPSGQQTTSTTTSTTRREVVTSKGDTVKSHTTKDLHGGTQREIHITRVVQENEQPVAPRPAVERPQDSVRNEVVTTRKETITTKTSESVPTSTTVQDDVQTMRVIREKEYLLRDHTPGDCTPRTPGERTPVPSTPGDRTPAVSTPGDRTPAVSTPGDRTPALRTPGDRTPAVQEIVCRLIPEQEQPGTPKDQQPDIKGSYTTKTTTTTVTTHVDTAGDKKVSTDERTQVKEQPIPQREIPQTREPLRPQQREPSPQPHYETPERRHPIKPGKSEMDERPTPTDGQYQTTYRTDYVTKRISVDVSPTHNAFASSLRAISPDRDKKRGSTRSLKSSTSSLRSSASPEKYPTDRPRGTSPTKRVSPDKYTSNETITKVTRRSQTKPTQDTVNTDTITRRRKDDTRTTTTTATRTSPDRKPGRPGTDNYISRTTTSTVSRTSPDRKPRPTTDGVTRTTTTTTTVARTSPDRKPVGPGTDHYSTTTTRTSRDDVRRTVTQATNVNETVDSSTLTRRPKDRPRSRSASPTTEASDIEYVRSNEIVTDLDAVDTTTTTHKTDIRTDVSKTQRVDNRQTIDVTNKKIKKVTDRSATSPSPTKEKPQFKRRDTYEIRCREILGLPEKPTTADTKVTKTRTDEITRTTRKPSDTPRRPSKSPTKDIKEFPSQIRRSPEKQPLEKVPGKTRPTKEGPRISEFPSQIRRSPEKQPLEKPPERRRPSKDKPKIHEFPSQIRRSPEKPGLEKPAEKTRVPSYQSKIQEFPAQVRRSPDKVKKVPELGKAPGAADEPLFTKKFISTLCRDDEVQRTDVRRTTERKSPEKVLPQTYGIPSDSDSDRPRGTVKKGSPERPSKTFIDTERIDTDITITEYERKSPDRRPTKERPDTEEYIETRDVTEYTDTDRRRKDTDSCRVTTTGVTEYTDEYHTPEGDRHRPHRGSPERPTSDVDTTRYTKMTDVTEYTDEYHKKITDGDRPRPKPKDRGPERSPGKIEGVTEYTDEYHKKLVTEEDRTRPKPRDRGPERSPEKIRGVTEYIDEYTDKRGRVTKTTTSTTRKTPKGTKPDDEETTDSETETTRVIKETTTIVNGHGPRRSPSKTTTKPKSGITEYPSQKPKPGTTKTTKTLTRKDSKDDKVTLYDVERTNKQRIDDKTHIRTHRIDDYYTTKTTKTLTNGDVPRGPKRVEPKSTRPGVTDTPGRKPTQRKPAELITEKRTTKIVSSPRSPDRYSPSRKTTDTQKIYSVTATRKTFTKTDTTESKPRTKTPTKTIPKQSETPKRHVVTTTIQVVPKTKPEGPRKPVGKTTVTTTTVRTTKLTEPKTKTKPRRPMENGRITTEDSETEEEITEDTCRVTRRSDTKVTRTTGDQITKTQRIPVRSPSKPESPSTRTTDKTTKKTDKKVITTKSIIINNDFDTEREVVVNLQRSKSSREPTPDRICPRPASEDEDTGVPRYPDQISEPDEPRRKPTRLSDIPIIESETTSKFTRVTDLDDDKTTVTRRVDRVDDEDECLLSVNQKVSKFVDEAVKLTKRQPKAGSPTRKTNVVDETRETCDSKVTKYLTTDRNLPERPKSPKCKNYPDDGVDEEGFTSVSEKVSHFIGTAQNIKSPQKPGLRDGPAPKVRRPEFTDVDETIKTDECLLSVSDKVSKFSTVHKIQSPDYKKPVSLAKIDITPKRESPTRESPRRDSVPRESPRRESPRRESPRRESPRREFPSSTTECVQIDSEEQTYTRRISPDRYSPTRYDREGSPRSYRDDKTPTRTVDRPSTLTREGKYVRKDLSIKELDTTPKSSRRDDEPKSVLSPTGRLRSTESIRKAKELFENIAKEQKTTTTTTTKQRDILSRPSVFEGRIPKRPDDDVKLTDIGVYKVKTTDTKTRDVRTKLRYSSDDEETTETTRRTIRKDDGLKSTRLIMDKLNRPRSPEKDDEAPGYLKPLDRAPRPHSPYYDRSRSPRPRSKSPSRERSPRPHDPSLDEIPHYMWPLDRSIHDHLEHERSHSPRSREPTPDTHGRIRSRASTPDNTPGYMKPLDRTVHPKSPQRAHEPDDDTERTTKFGVTLRKTDSGRTNTTTTTTTTTASQRRKLSAVEIERILTTHEIEEIYELEILEILLERAVNYEQRRRIRSQIRIVKQLISENRLHTVIKKTKTVSPTRDAKPRGTSPEKPARKSVEKYQTEIVRKISPTRKTVENKTYQHTDVVSKQSSYAYSERRTSSEVKTHMRGASPETKIIRASPEKAPRRSITTVEKVIRQSPERKTQVTESRRVFKTELKRTTPSSKTVVEDKPTWVTQRPLKKPSEIPERKTSSTTSTTTTRKQITSRTSPSKERKPIDDITSSYGVGPTDENGSPLFGLKALRAQNRTDTTKVQGTVIRSHYYAENGQEPTGEISVTKYSTDPRDLDGNVHERNGLVSVTTTQKFGTKGTPSYKSVIDKKKITDLDDEEERLTKTSTTKVTRRGSVKEMSKKFIENAVETSKNERQSSYPKAGLILRTSSFKDTAKGGTSSSRESSPEKQTTVTTTTVRKTTSSSSSGGRTDTFLNNKTRVRGVQDVITRMKNADDGMETRCSASTPSTAATVRRTTTTTTSTSKGGGKPTVTTRTFTHPITEDDLKTVWDEQTLKLLLERSTDYEERQIIRTRIRDVMAEQEVCADVVAKSKEESSGRIEEKVETSKKTFTEGPVTTTQVTTRVTNQQVTKKPISPFAKFRQLDKQNSLNSPGTPRTPTGSRPLFKFTDPEVQFKASTVKERLLQWCQMKTKEYENLQLENFSSSWADGLAFCALIHHFLPDAFDYHALSPKNRKHNFELAFRVADEKADILPLLDVEDMLATRKPDWKCVFTYVQTIYSRFKDED